jgi:hypothetical protein
MSKINTSTLLTCTFCTYLTTELIYNLFIYSNIDKTISNVESETDCNKKIVNGLYDYQQYNKSCQISKNPLCKRVNILKFGTNNILYKFLVLMIIILLNFILIKYYFEK